MVKKGVKAQAALEFLTTYAWAFFVILVTIGGLYYFGIFEFGSYIPQSCDFPSQFQCIDFAFVDDNVRFQILNSAGEELQIDSFDITSEAASPLTCTFLPPVGLPWQPNEQRIFDFDGCSGGVFQAGERVTAQVTIRYYATASPSQSVHEIKGRINAVVNT